MISALDLLLTRRGHSIVAQIIETELAVRSVGHILRVLLAPDIRRLIVLNDAHRQPQESVKLPHPLGVTPGQVVVHRHQMCAAPA